MNSHYDQYQINANISGLKNGTRLGLVAIKWGDNDFQEPIRKFFERLGEYDYDMMTKEDIALWFQNYVYAVCLMQANMVGHETTKDYLKIKPEDVLFDSEVIQYIDSGREGIYILDRKNPADKPYYWFIP